MDVKYKETRVGVFVIFLGIVLYSYGCKSPSSANPYPYSPDDFSEPIKDLLSKIEQHNILYLTNSGCRGSGEIYDSAQVYYPRLGKIATTYDLLKISKCSNPTIRAYALTLMLEDKKVNISKIIREHLYDTAQIFDDYGQTRWSVISFMLHNTYGWPKIHIKDEIKKEILQKIPFERAAYYLLDDETPMDTFPGYYDIVREMARNLQNWGYRRGVNWFTGISALNVLASYKKASDISLIDSIIDLSLQNGNGQFFPAQAIQNFPDTTFEKYYLDTSYRWMSLFRFLRQDYSYDFYYEPNDGLKEILDLIITHKSARSAIMLERILERPPYLYYVKLSEYERQLVIDDIKSSIAVGIRENYSPYYDGLIKKTETVFRNHKKNRILE